MARERDNILLKVSLTGKTLRFADKDLSMSNYPYYGRARFQGLILDQQFPDILSPSPVKSALTVNLENGDGGLDADLANYNWHNRKVEALTGEGFDESGFVDRFTGIIRFPKGLAHSEKRVQLMADDIKSKDNRLILTDKFDATTYPNAPASTLGKVIPALWGEYAHPSLITPYCSDNSSDYGLDFKIAGHAIKEIGDIYVIEHEVKTKSNLEYEYNSKDTTNAKFVAAGFHRQTDLSAINANAERIVAYASDGTYLYAIAKITVGSGSKFGCYRWDGDSWTERGTETDVVGDACLPYSALCYDGIVLVGCGKGYIWRSIDGGQNWDNNHPGQQGNDNLNPIYCMTQNPDSTGDELFYGTEQWESPFDHRGQVFQREDPDTSWSLLYQFSVDSGAVRSITYCMGRIVWGTEGYSSANRALASHDGSTQYVDVADAGVPIYFVSPDGRGDNLVFGGIHQVFKLSSYKTASEAARWDLLCQLDSSSYTLVAATRDAERDAVYILCWTPGGVSDNDTVKKLKGSDLEDYWQNTGVNPGGGHNVNAIFVYGDYVVWNGANGNDHKGHDVYCNSVLTDDDDPTKLTGSFGIEASGRKDGSGNLIEEPTDVAIDILKNYLSVVDANIDSDSAAAVAARLNNDGAGEFKVHNYQTKSVKGIQLLLDLCAQCGILPSVRDNKYYFQYLFGISKVGTEYGGQDSYEVGGFDAKDHPDYLNQLILNHKYDPSTGEYLETVDEENATAQSEDQCEEKEERGFYWRYNDSDHITVADFAEKVVAFLSSNPAYVKATIHGEIGTNLGDTVKVTKGHMSATPVLVRQIKKDILQHQDGIEGWDISDLDTVITPDIFWTNEGQEFRVISLLSFADIHAPVGMASHGGVLRIHVRVKDAEVRARVGGAALGTNLYSPGQTGGATAEKKTLEVDMRTVSDGTYIDVVIQGKKTPGGADPRVEMAAMAMGE